MNRRNDLAATTTIRFPRPAARRNGTAAECQDTRPMTTSMTMTLKELEQRVAVLSAGSAPYVPREGSAVHLDPRRSEAPC